MTRFGPFGQTPLIAGMNGTDRPAGAGRSALLLFSAQVASLFLAFGANGPGRVWSFAFWGASVRPLAVPGGASGASGDRRAGRIR
jgi:hypothetical protein